MKTYLFLAVVFLFTRLVEPINLDAASAQVTAGHVGRGVVAGKGLLDLFNSLNHSSKFATKLATAFKKITPFLGAIGPALVLVTAIIPKQPTQFEKDVMSNFSKIHQSFDKVFSEFKDVKNLIETTSMKAQYGRYEQQIEWQSKHLQNLLEANSSNVASRKTYFLKAYSLHLNQPTWILYNFMIGNSTMSDNIPRLAMSYTNNNRKQVQHFLSGILNLIIKGVTVHLAYLKLHGGYTEGHYNKDEREWAERVKEIIKHIETVDTEVKNKWKNQFEQEALNIASRDKDKSHEEVAEAMYNHLSKKYDWRKWFVVVYDPVTGGEKHEDKTCGGFYKFRYRGLNILVASNDENNPGLTGKEYYDVRGLRDRTLIKKWHWYYGLRHVPLGAKYMLDTMVPKYLVNAAASCGRYRAVGVIETKANPAYKGSEGRYAVANTRKNDYKIHVFA